MRRVASITRGAVLIGFAGRGAIAAGAAGEAEARDAEPAERGFALRGARAWPAERHVGIDADPDRVAVAGVHRAARPTPGTFVVAGLGAPPALLRRNAELAEAVRVRRAEAAEAARALSRVRAGVDGNGFGRDRPVVRQDRAGVGLSGLVQSAIGAAGEVPLRQRGVRGDLAAPAGVREAHLDVRLGGPPKLTAPTPHQSP
jgi:hypothetical protein